MARTMPRKDFDFAAQIAKLTPDIRNENIGRISARIAENVKIMRKARIEILTTNDDEAKGASSINLAEKSIETERLRAIGRKAIEDGNPHIFSRNPKQKASKP